MCISCGSDSASDEIDHSKWSDVPTEYHTILNKFESSPPKRVISISPSITELIYEVGAGDLLVGATIPHNYPPEAKDLPSIGDMSLDLEKIIALDPDILIGEGNLFAGVVDNIRELGIPVLLFDTRKVGDVFTNLKCLTYLFKITSTKKLNEIENARVSLQKKSKTDENETVSVAPIVSSTPLILAASDSYFENLIEASGGESITKDIPGDYITLSKEDLINRNPDVILYTFKGIAEDLKADTTLSEVSAIKSNRLYEVDPDLVLRPTLRSIVQGIPFLHELFQQK